MSDSVNIDAQSLRDRLYRAWMQCEGMSIERMANEMDISPFTLRTFLNNKASRYTTTMRLKILKWIEAEEKCKNVNAN